MTDNRVIFECEADCSSNFSNQFKDATNLNINSLPDNIEFSIFPLLCDLSLDLTEPPDEMLERVRSIEIIERLFKRWKGICFCDAFYKPFNSEDK